MIKTISSIGEKRFIREFIKPFYNAENDPAGVGDDCAMVAFGNDIALISTDRVPQDLIAYKLGILDFFGLGDYLARLNLSDIAACGGKPVGLLLNLGLPSDIAEKDVVALCQGFGAGAMRNSVDVLGGDITSAIELSISATSIGKALKGKVLNRRNARPGDSIFVSRPVGVTPAAFIVFLSDLERKLSGDLIHLLKRQFTDLDPLIPLGRALSDSGLCGACMDNTDGIGQSLTELSEASNCSFVIDVSRIKIPSVVQTVGRITGRNPMDFAFNGGADFSLIGTLRGTWSSESASIKFGYPLEIVGQVESGEGVWIEGDKRTKLTFQGWNYFLSMQP